MIVGLPASGPLITHDAGLEIRGPMSMVRLIPTITNPREAKENQELVRLLPSTLIIKTTLKVGGRGTLWVCSNTDI